MSDKIDGLVVTFKTEVSEEYAEKIKDAIRMFNHVISVDFIAADYLEKSSQEVQVKKQVREILFKFIKEEL